MVFWQREHVTISLTLGKIDSLPHIFVQLGDIHFSTLADNRLHPEAMPEPTEENPVPLVKDMPLVAMKDVYIGRGGRRRGAKV
jgi:hypothetical protein